MYLVGGFSKTGLAFSGFLHPYKIYTTIVRRQYKQHPRLSPHLYSIMLPNGKGAAACKQVRHAASTRGTAVPWCRETDRRRSALCMIHICTHTHTCPSEKRSHPRHPKNHEMERQTAALVETTALSSIRIAIRRRWIVNSISVLIRSRSAGRRNEKREADRRVGAYTILV